MPFTSARRPLIAASSRDLVFLFHHLPQCLLDLRIDHLLLEKILNVTVGDVGQEILIDNRPIFFHHQRCRRLGLDFDTETVKRRRTLYGSRVIGEFPSRPRWMFDDNYARRGVMVMDDVSVFTALLCALHHGANSDNPAQKRTVRSTLVTRPSLGS
jgi:hypothetical protein